MNRKIIWTILFLSVFTVCMSGCVTNTLVTIEANVENAELFLDGESQGELPTELCISNAIWNDPTVRVEAKGYKPIEGKLIKEIKLLNGLVGLIWWPNLLWSYGPYPYQFFLLTPIAPINESI